LQALTWNWLLMRVNNTTGKVSKHLSSLDTGIETIHIGIQFLILHLECAFYNALLQGGLATLNSGTEDLY